MKRRRRSSFCDTELNFEQGNDGGRSEQEAELGVDILDIGLLRFHFQWTCLLNVYVNSFFFWFVGYLGATSSEVCVVSPVCVGYLRSE